MKRGVAFDVDCGELIPGHHFIARGLGGPFRLPVPDDWDGDSTEYEQVLEFAVAGGYPGFTLEYELVPGVSATQAQENCFRYLVSVSYDADVELPWRPGDGGAIAPFVAWQRGLASRRSRDWALTVTVVMLRRPVIA